MSEMPLGLKLHKKLTHKKILCQATIYILKLIISVPTCPGVLLWCISAFYRVIKSDDIKLSPSRAGLVRWCQCNDFNKPKLSAFVNDLCGKGKRWTLQQDWGGPGAKKARCQLSTAPVESAHQLDIIHANHGDKKNTIIHTSPDDKKKLIFEEKKSMSAG